VQEQDAMLRQYVFKQDDSMSVKNLDPKMALPMDGPVPPEGIENLLFTTVDQQQFLQQRNHDDKQLKLQRKLIDEEKESMQKQRLELEKRAIALDKEKIELLKVAKQIQEMKNIEIVDEEIQQQPTLLKPDSPSLNASLTQQPQQSKDATPLLVQKAQGVRTIPKLPMKLEGGIYDHTFNTADDEEGVIDVIDNEDLDHEVTDEELNANIRALYQAGIIRAVPNIATGSKPTPGVQQQPAQHFNTATISVTSSPNRNKK